MTDETTPTDQQLRALAALICTLRPDWDSPGVLANLRQTWQGGIHDLASAAITAAGNPANRTPAAIRWQQEPAAAGIQGRAPRHGNQAPCEVCGRNQWGCRKAQANTGLDSHPYQPAASHPPNTDPLLMKVAQYAGEQFTLNGRAD